MPTRSRRATVRGLLVPILGACLLLAALPAAPLSAAPLPAAPAPDPVGAFVPLQAARLYDSRDGTRVVDRGFARAPGPIGPGGTVGVPVAGRGGVPEVGAGTVVLDITGTTLFGSSAMTVWPQGAPRPPTSTLSLSPTEPVSRTVVTKLGDGGAVSLFNLTGLSDATVDVVGWFPEASPLVSGVPQRLLDTRAEGGPLAAGEPRRVVVDGRGFAPAPPGSAVLVNLTATGATDPTAVTAWPTGGPRPAGPVLTPAPGRTVSTMTVVGVGADGALDLANATGTVELLVDVVAVLPRAVGTATAAARLMDTRAGGTTVDGAQAGAGRLAPGTTRTLPVLGRGGVPTRGVSSVLMTVTGTAPDAAGAIGVWGAGPPPTTSAVVVPVGEERPGFAVVPVAPDGTVQVAVAGARMDVAVDVVGWLAGTPRDVSGAAVPDPALPGAAPAPSDEDLAEGAAPGTPTAPPIDDGGRLLWQADFAQGLAAFRSTPWNIVGAPAPRVTQTAAGPGVQFSMPGGGRRAEIEPSFRSLRDGDDLYFGFSVTLAPGFPAGTDDWQVIAQWKDEGIGSPPLSIKVGKGQFLLDGGFDRGAPFQVPMGAAVPGRTQSVVTHVVFGEGGGSVDAWVDGKQTLRGFRPPAGTLYPGLTSYLKTGIYRDPAIGAPGTLVFDDWRIGTSYGAVAPR